MDLIILALIAGFIVYRLYVTLGEKTGYQGDGSQDKNNIVDFSTKKPAAVKAPSAQTEKIPTAFRKAVQEITKKDPDFSLESFKEGASMAFEMILEAYPMGDTKTLKKLLAPDVFKAFKSAIEGRKAAGQTLENTLVRVEEILIQDVSIQDDKAQIHVRYTTEQVPILKDSAGEIIDGCPNQIDQVIDTWTFEKSLKSNDPNWLLVSTES